MRNSEIADAWLNEHVHCGKGGLFVLTGMRGTGKSSALEAFRLRVRGRCAPDDDMFSLNCENRLLQRIHTGEQLWNYTCDSTSGGRLFLFIDEASAFTDIVCFLERAFASGRCHFICATASSVRLFSSLPADMEVHACRLIPDGAYIRTRVQLERLWDALFLRDVLNGLRQVDVRAVERVAEWVSDHMGDNASLRRISADLAATGCHLSHNTVDAYLHSLQDAYLVERVGCWDAFEQVEVKMDYCFFFTDLELRRHRFGPSPLNEAHRLSRALAYLELRRSQGTVFTVRGGLDGADFVTFKEGRAHFWRALPGGPVPVL